MISLSRTQLPISRKSTLRRARLLEQLHENVQRKLTFVCAPAGYGKTTLLREFARDVEMAVAWYQTGPDDEHLPVFFGNLLNAFEHVASDFGANLAGPGGRAPDPEALATVLLNRMVERLDNFTLLILEDYHLVNQDSAIVQFMEALLAGLPEHVRLVISSRSVYGIPTAHLFVHQELAVLADHELRFRTEELQDLARLIQRRTLTDAELTELEHGTDGWPLAAAVALQAGTRLPQQPLRLLNAQEQLFAYFRDELLPHLSPPAHRLLLLTAPFEGFTVDLAAALLDGPPVEPALQELFDRNLFISRLDQPGPEAFTYHHLFRDFLREGFGELPAAEQAVVYRRAAAWFEAQADWPAAIQNWLAADDRLAAARIMNRVARATYASGGDELLSAWYESIAGDPLSLAAAPELLLNLAKSRINRNELLPGAELLDRAEPAFRAADDVENLCNLWVTRGMLYRFSGKYPESLALARQVQSTVRARGIAPFYALQAGRLEGLAHFYLGRLEPALAQLDQAATGLRGLLATESTPRTLHELIAVLTDIGYIAITHGRIALAEAVYHEALQLTEGLPANAGNRAICANNAAYLQHMLGNYDQALALYEQALAAARHSGWRRVLVDVHNGRGDLLRDREAIDLAQACYEDALALAAVDPSGLATAESWLGLADVARRRQDYSRAQGAVREARRQGGLTPDSLAARTAEAAIFLSMGQARLALERLEDRGQDADAGSDPVSVRADFLLGLARQALDQPGAAPAVAHGLEGAARLGYDAFLLPLVREHGPALAQLQEALGSPQLDSLLRRAAAALTPLAPPDPPQAERLPAQLTVRCLGRPAVWVDERLLDDADWQSSGARQLFYYILACGPVRKDQIALTFWPDFSPGKINSNFHATLWRVRHALGYPAAIHFDGRSYRLHPDLVCRSDVAAFEDQVRSLAGLTPGSPAWQDGAHQALALYAGDYLPDVDMPWAQDRARELQQRFLEIVTGLAEAHLAAGRARRSLALFEQAVARDPYEDRWRLGVLRCLARLKRTQTARRYFHDYQELLARELGVDPTAELRDFVQRLT